MQERQIRLANAHEVSEFVQAAGKCDFDIDVYYNHVFVDGKSMLGVMGLDLTRVLNVKFSGHNDRLEEVLNKYAVSMNTAA